MRERRLALTFDAEHPDRPGAQPGTPERILDVLADDGTRATFFLEARWATAYPAVARRIAADDHLIGNHSAYHARMTSLTDEGLRTDIRVACEKIAEVTKVDPHPWFRCPYGDGRDDPRVIGALDDLGYRNVHWHVTAQDWEPDRTAADIARGTVEGAARHGDGGVVLLHTWPAATAEALPELLSGLREDGATLVAVDALGELP